MNELTEDELRAAFSARVASLSAERSRRLQAIDYPAAGRQRRNVLTAVGACAGVLSAGVAAVVLLLAGSTPVAFADWTAIPARAAPAAIASAKPACDALWNDTFRRSGPRLTSSPTLSETRGKSTALLDVIGGQVWTCIATGSIPSTTGQVQAAGAQPTSPDNVTGPYGSPGVAAKAAGERSGGNAQRYYEGRAGSAVSAVTFIFADHTEVHASVEHRWYFAWWPSDHGEPTSIKVTSTSGTRRSPFALQTVSSSGAAASMTSATFVSRTREPDGAFKILLSNGHSITLTVGLMNRLDAARRNAGLKPIPLTRTR